jgi:hypothetical protein
MEQIPTTKFDPPLKSKNLIKRLNLDQVSNQEDFKTIHEFIADNPEINDLIYEDLLLQFIFLLKKAKHSEASPLNLYTDFTVKCSKL